MKKILALEEAAQLAICSFAMLKLGVGMNGWIVLLFFVPDLFAVGYVISKTAGALMYNFAHHKLTAVLLVFGGLIFKQDYLTFTGLLAYAHSSFDRMIGYGLKYMDSPEHTHLGYIGKAKHKNKQGTALL